MHYTEPETVCYRNVIITFFLSNYLQMMQEISSRTIKEHTCSNESCFQNPKLVQFIILAEVDEVYRLGVQK